MAFPMLELTPGKRSVLERALRFYMSTYQEMAGKEKEPAAKADLQAYVKRGAELFDEIRALSGLPVSQPAADAALPRKE